MSNVGSYHSFNDGSSRRASMSRQPSRKITLAESTEATMDPKFNDYKMLFSVEEKPNLVEAQSEVGETKAEFRQRWISLGIVYIVNFLLVIQNSLYWSSLWPYLSQIDKTASESFFGYVIMAFNLASAVASPLFGMWSNRLQQTRIPITVGICVTIVGNCLLAFAEDFTSGRKWVVFVARFITGFGLGNQGSIYAYVAMASKVEERNKAIALRAAVNSLGLMLGPAMQAAFVPIGFPGFVRGKFVFNMYTAPAYVNMAIGVIQVVIMMTVFRDVWVSVDESQMNKEKEKEDIKQLKPFDKVAVGASIYVRLVILFCFSYDTTIGSPFTMAMFKWTPSQAVTYNSFISISMGVINFVASLVVGTVILKYVQERVLIVVGLSSFILFYVISFPWPGLPPMVPEAQSNGANFNTTTIVGSTPLTSTVFSGQTLSATTEAPYSCDYIWCSYTTRVNLAQYLVAYVCMALAFAVAYTPNGTLFSKLLGPRKQGTMQGVFAAAGQVAMTISPLVCSNLFQYSGPRATWVTGAAVLLSAILVVLLLFKKFVPWQDDGVGVPEENTLLLADGDRSAYSAIEQESDS